MLQFYEAHLQFNDTVKSISKKYVPSPSDDDAPAEDSPQTMNGTSKDDEAEDDIVEEEDEEMGGIKGVASAVAGAVADVFG